MEDEVPAEFSATTLRNFRLASLGSQAVLWTAFSLIFGVLAERRLSRTSSRSIDRR
jgi:hypothetical protein